MNVTDSDNDMGNYEEGNRDKIQLRIIFMCFAIGVGVGVMACVHVGRKVSFSSVENLAAIFGQNIGRLFRRNIFRNSDKCQKMILDPPQR